MKVRLPNPLIAVAWCAAFLPAGLGGGWPQRALALAVSALGAIVMYVKPSPWEARRPSRDAARLFVALQVAAAISWVYSAAFNGGQAGAWDWFELPRFLLSGLFVLYLIRHYDAKARQGVERALLAGLYGAWLILPASAYGYLATILLCHLLFYSRSSLRYGHAASAACLIALQGGRGSWGPALLVAAAALALRLHRALAHRRVRFALQWSVMAFALLSVGPPAALQRLSPPPGPSREARLFGQSPLFGWGPVALESFSPAASQYSVWLVRGGILGFSLLMLGAAMAAYALARAAGRDAVRLVGAASFVAALALLLKREAYLESYPLFYSTAFVMAGMLPEAR